MYYGGVKYGLVEARSVLRVAVSWRSEILSFWERKNMKSQFKKIVVVVVLSALAFPSYAAIEPEPNRPTDSKVQSSVDAPQREVTQNLVPQESRPPGQIEAELGKEYYKDCVQTLRWALGIIVAFVAYVVFKSGREHKEALADVKQTLGDAREACKEARAASDKAREYEEKAQERLSRVDEMVGAKLKEIEEKGKALIASLIQEGEKQRKISELWNEGSRAAKAEDFAGAADCFRRIIEDFKVENAVAYNNWGAALCDLAKRKEGAESEELFRASFEKYEKAVQIKPDYHMAYSNWGNALSDLARRKTGAESEELFRASFEKYQKAVQIKPDYHEAYSNWGKAILILEKSKDGENRGKLLDEAKQKCLKAESIKEGSGAYNLACASVLLGEETECRKWLETGERCGTLPTRGYVMSDADLESVRDKEWFKQIQWPQKGN